MPARFRFSPAFFISGLLLLALTVVFFQVKQPRLTYDPDYFYHVKVSELSAEQGTLAVLPQVEDLGWGTSFPDKEYLFHVFSTWAYQIGGEPGIQWFVYFLFAGIVMSLFVIGWRIYPSIMTPVAILLLLAVNLHFQNRVFLLRPQMLAMLCFVWLLASVLLMRPMAAAIFAMLFALSYHAIYIPAAVIGAGILMAGVRTSRGCKFMLFGFFGLLIGLIVSPYFPENIVMTFQHFKIAAGQFAIPMRDYGLELMPLTSNVFLKEFGLLIVVYLGVFSLLVANIAAHPPGLLAGFLEKVSLSKPEQSFTLQIRRLVFLLLLMSTFFALTAITPRANEYLMPTTIIACVYALSLVRNKKIWNGIFTSVGLGFLILYAIPAYRLLPPPPLPQMVKTALDHLPSDATGKKIFNCNWGHAPFILYNRPDMRFIDILDPSLLLAVDSDLYQERNSIINGPMLGRYLSIKFNFQAEFVLCDKPELLRHLKSDPHFIQHYPTGPYAPPDNDFYLFELVKVPRKEFVQQLQVYPMALTERSGLSDQNLMDAEPAGIWAIPVATDGTPVGLSMNLRPAATVRQEAKDDRFECYRVDVAADEIIRLAGADTLIVGGNGQVRVWLNGKPIFQLPEFPGDLILSRKTFLLSETLQPGTKVSVMMCNQQNAIVALTLALWRKTELAEFCAASRRNHPESTSAEWSDDHELKAIDCLDYK